MRVMPGMEESSLAGAEVTFRVRTWTAYLLSVVRAGLYE
jgi:hypothetical protein